MSIAPLGPFLGGRAPAIWPSVRIDGDLERTRIEWLHTNGAGAFAGSTVAQMHTRRYHGLLVGALEPPRRRHVILSHMDATVQLGKARYELATHQFPNVPPSAGYRHLVQFDQDPLPRWTFRLEQGELEQTLALVRGKNCVILRYLWRGPGSPQVTVRPLLALRHFHHLVHEHGSMLQSVELRQGEVRVRPVPALPRVVFGHTGTFIGSPDWWHRFEYLAEQARGLDFQEDLWTPGVFSLSLDAGVPVYITAALEALPAGTPADLLAQAADALLAADPGPESRPLVRRLSIAAEAFRADDCPTPGIVAGYHWFEVWGRDSLLSLPGLYLVPGKIAEARRILASLTSTMADGLVPNRLPDAGEQPEYHTADATLWLFEAARLFADRAGWDDPFCRGELFAALRGAFEAVMRGTRHNIHVTSEGLYAAADLGFALTWMDARVGSWVVTPRAGLPVELQALWARACETLARFAEAAGDRPLAARARDAYERAVFSFRRRFWCQETGYPYDVVSEQAGVPGEWRDPSIRPNAVIALAVEPLLFDPAQTASLLAVAERDLVTPAGLRTLAPGSPGYTGRYGGGVRERDASYHQGTVWPYLLGFYVRAARRHRPHDASLAARLEALVASAASNALALGQVPEIADGDPPHRPNGCVAQAWSVAELLRALVWDLA